MTNKPEKKIRKTPTTNESNLAVQKNVITRLSEWKAFKKRRRVTPTVYYQTQAGGFVPGYEERD